MRNHRKTTRHTTGLFQCRGSITCNWSETGLTRWLQGGGTGSGRPGRSAKQGPHGAYHTSRLRDSGWSQPGHTVRCPDAGTGEQGPVPTGTCSVHTGYCVCPCVPCVPYVSRLPPVSFYRQLMLASLLPATSFFDRYGEETSHTERYGTASHRGRGHMADCAPSATKPEGVTVSCYMLPLSGVNNACGTLLPKPKRRLVINSHPSGSQRRLLELFASLWIAGLQQDWHERIIVMMAGSGHCSIGKQLVSEVLHSVLQRLPFSNQSVVVAHTTVNLWDYSGLHALWQ